MVLSPAQGAGSELGVLSRAPLPRSCHTSGTGHCASIWIFLDLGLDSFCLSCRISHQQRAEGALTFFSVAQPAAFLSISSLERGSRKVAPGAAGDAALCAPPMPL